MTSLSRSTSAPLRLCSRYNSVLESALVGLGREDAVVFSARKKKRYHTSHAVRGMAKVFSAPERRSQTIADDDEDPFASLQIIKAIKKKKKRREREKQNVSSPALTRSATKLKRLQSQRFVGVLEMAGCTPVTRSMARKNSKRSSLEMIEDVELEPEPKEDVNFNIRKKLVFPSPNLGRKRKKRKLDQEHCLRSVKINEKKKERVNRKAIVLKHWWIGWPIKFEAGSENIEMEILGSVGGKVLRFIVGKREGATKFTSKDGEYVALSGKLDRDTAKSTGIPRAVMKIMEDGIPPRFCKRLLPLVHKSQKVEEQKSVATHKLANKRGRKSVNKRLIMPAVKEGKDTAITSPSSSGKNLDRIPKTRRIYTPKQKRKRSVCTDKCNEMPDADAWTDEQLQALSKAKQQIPTTVSNFWAQVAQYVTGKSAQECQSKTFEHFRSPPTNRKAANKQLKRADINKKLDGTSKLSRAGSNKFKKQVREFVEEYEKMHVDDVFDSTPSKEGLPELPDFGAIKSPELATPSYSVEDEDSDKDNETPFLKKLSSRRRDDIDSYVLGINRQHVAGGGKMVCGKVKRVTAISTPSNAKATKATKATSSKRKAMSLVEDLGSHSMKADVSPGGTARVRIEMDSSLSENENLGSSEEEEDFDIF
ncbi:putative SANT/Myb domain, Homeobox-like domain superfamily, SANT associated [Plasmopara halstedii]